eukprot:gene21351-27381_t
MVLEENLRFHSTLTVGDQLTVWYRGNAHALVVVELRPDPQGNLFDTDVEVDLELSQEGEALRLKDEQDRAEQEKRSKMNSTSSSQTIVASGGAAPSVFAFGQARTLNETATTATRADITVSSSRGNEQYAQLLLPEPEEGASLRIKIRLPSGKNVMRKFDAHTALAQVFYYVGAELSLTEEQLTSVQLTSKAINRTFRLTAEERDLSLREVGLSDSNILLIASLL